VLRDAGLRATQARIDVYEVLAASDAPLSHREAAVRLPDADRVTVFRSLVALTEAGLAVRVDLGDRTWRYALAEEEHAHEAAGHAHFTCTACGRVTCLDDLLIAGPPGQSELLRDAEITVRGTCDDCR